MASKQQQQQQQVGKDDFFLGRLDVRNYHLIPECNWWYRCNHSSKPQQQKLELVSFLFLIR